MSEQHLQDEAFLAEIKALLTEKKDPSKIDLLNQQIAALTDPTITITLELSSHIKDKVSGIGSRCARVGLGVILPESRIAIVENRVSVPINPHLLWQNAFLSPNQFSLIEDSFHTETQGINALNDELPMRLKRHHRFHHLQHRKRLTIALGEEALTLYQELHQLFNIPQNALHHFQTK